MAAGSRPGPITTSTLWASRALFVGLGLLLAGTGLFATVVGIRVETEEFPTVVIGVVMAAYYLGFLVGARLTLVALGRVGHIRVYTALASVLAAVILAAGLVVHPVPWTIVRFLAGASVAGQYVVAESWLNQLATNVNRGRILSVYMIVTAAAFGLGQLSVGLVDPGTLSAFAVAAVLITLAVTPVALSADASPPLHQVTVRLPLRDLARIAPTGVVTSGLVGVAHGAFIGLTAVYASRSGLDPARVGLFVTMPTLGSLVLQMPIASTSDLLDRRIVGAVTAAVAAGGALGLLAAGPISAAGAAAMFVIGGATFPLYSVAGAYTNDSVPGEMMTAAASQLVVVYGTGALIGPLLASTVMRVVGNDGFVWSVLGAHSLIAVFLLVRVVQYRPSVRALPENAVELARPSLPPPATAAAMGRLVSDPDDS